MSVENYSKKGYCHQRYTHNHLSSVTHCFAVTHSFTARFDQIPRPNVGPEPLSSRSLRVMLRMAMTGLMTAPICNHLPNLWRAHLRINQAHHLGGTRGTKTNLLFLGKEAMLSVAHVGKLLPSTCSS